MATIKGTAGNDTLTGTAVNDTFNVVQGGEDTVSGLAGNDTFHFNAAFDAGDQVDGGDGKDSVLLRGDYSAGVTFNATTMVNVEDITVAAGNDYNLTTNDGNVAAGQSLFINAATLGATDKLTFDGSAETDGSFTIEGGKGDDVVTGGAGDDAFKLYQGGEDSAHGGAGNDTFYMGATLDAGDTLDGGAGSGSRNVVELNGDYSAGTTLGAATLSNIQEIEFHSGHSYNITTNDANFAAGTTVVVNAAHLSGGRVLTFNAGAETDASFRFFGGAGNDVITGGQAGDIYDLSQGGHDTVHGGAGSDTFIMGGALGSNDSIDGGAGNDGIQMNGMGTASALTFKATTMVNVENLVLLGGHDYVLTTNDANVAAGASLTVNAVRLGAGDTLTFNGAAETDGSFIITAGIGDATLTGGAEADTFNITRGGTDTIHGGGGDDIITAAGMLTAADSIDGGTGNDTVKINGDYSAGLVLNDTTLTNVETLSLAAGHSYKLTAVDGNVAAGETLTVDGSALGANDKLTFDGSAETNGSFDIKGGADADMIAVTAANVSGDTIDGGAGNDTIALSGSGAVTLSGTKITNVETVSFANSGSYAATVSGNITSGNGALTLNAAALTAGHSASVDISAATSTVNFTGGAGDDVLTVGGNLVHLGTINGGAGTDTLAFSGNLSKPTLSNVNITRVEKLVFADGNSYPTITIVGDLTGVHSTLDIDASALTGSSSIAISAPTATSGIDFTGGAGNDTLVLSEVNIADAGTTADGGAGDNALQIETIKGPLNVSLTGTQFQHFDELDFSGTFAVTVDVTNDFVGTASTLTIGAFSLSGSAKVDVSSVASATVDFMGGSGNDTIVFSNASHNWGLLIGENGNNTLELTGGGSATLSDSSIHQFNSLVLTNGHYSEVTVVGDITTGAPSLTIDASATTGANIDLSAATTSLINVTGGTGDDYVIFNAFNAAATFVGGDGYNEIAYQTPQSGMTFTSAHYSDVDEIDFNGTGDYTNISVVGDLTAGGDNAGDIDIYAGVLTGKIAVDLSAVTTSEIDFGGSTGDDTVTLSTANFNGSFLDGQSGNDTVIIAGDGTDFTSHTLTNSNARNIANFDLTGDNNFSMKFAAGIGEATHSVNVDASALTAGYSATVDFSLATTNALGFTGGAGDDTVLFSVGSLAHASGVSGGDGNNTFALTGEGQDVSTTFDGSAFSSFSTLAFENGNNYEVTVASDFTGASALNVDASALSSNFGATVDVTAIGETVNFTGGAGNDTVIFSSDNDNWGTVNGGAGNNTFEFNDGTAAIVDGASVTNFSMLSFADGHDYVGIHVTGDITGNNGTLTVDSSDVSGGHTVDVDLSGVTSSGIDFIGGAGDDTVVFGANLANVVSADGGGGNNTFELTGNGQDVTTTFSGANLANFSDLALADGDNYDITVTGGFGGEAGLNIDASALSSTHGATIDASGLTSFSVDFTGGAGDDTILAGDDLANMTIDGGGGNDVLKLDGDYSAGVPLSAVSNIAEIDLTGHSNYVLTTADATVAAGATLTVDASALGPNFGLTFDGSAETDGYFNIKGGAGDDSLTLQTFEVDNSSIDGGAGFNTVTLTGTHAGDESFNAASFAHIDNIDYAVGSLGEELSFTGDITGDGSTLTVDETNADGIGGSGPDGDMLITDISALTDTIDLTGAVVDDYVVVSSANWTSLNGNGGNYNALIDTSTGPITFDAATITGFNTLVFNVDLNGNAVDFSGIGVVGDLTGNGGTVTIDARFSNSISIDLSQATSDIAFDGSTGDDTIAFGNTFSADDTVAGGGGNDTLSLGRNNATLADTAVTGVGTVTLSGGSAFAVTGDISANGTLTVDASALSDPHDVANINFSQATTGVINFTSGAGGDRVTFSASEANWGLVDGGAGDNNFILTGGGTASIDGASVTDFSTIILRDGGSYTLTLSGDIEGSGQTLTVGAGALSGGNSVSVDASASTDKISFTGGAGDDTFTGSSHGDTIALGFGGIDTVHGGAGDDTITAKALTVGGDFLDGGAGANTLSISGVGEADLNGATVTNIQTLNLSANDVVIIGDITGGQALTINVTALSGATVDLTQATTSAITVNGSAGSDTLLVTTDSVTDVTAYNGGGGSDTLALSDANDSGDWNIGSSVFQGLTNIVLDNAGALTISGDVTGNGGTLTVDASALGSGDIADVDFSAATSLVNITGGAGGDTFTAGNSLVAGDTINGGGGDDQVALSGDYLGLTLTATTLTNIADLQLESGSFNITSDDATVAAGQVLTVSAEFLGAGNTLTFNGAAETDGSFDFQVISSSIANGGVTLTGGAGDDTLDIDSSFSTITLDDTHFQSIETVDFFTGTLTITGNITASPFGTLTVDDVGGSGFPTTVDLSQATTPTIDFAGGGGDDTLIFGSNLSNVGTADGGGGTNTLELTGNGTDVTAGFIGANFTNFTPTITFEDGNNYHLFVQSGFAGNDVLTLDASQLSASYGAIVNVSRAAIGDVNFTGGAGDDTIVFGNGFSQVGSVDGGGGTNTVGLAGSTTGADIVANFDGSEFANFSGLQLEEGDSYGITVVNGFTGNDVINIDASQLTSGYRTSIDVSQVSLTVNFAGGTDDDTLIFGANIGNAGTVDGGGGTNTLELTGGGNDVTTTFAGASFTNFHALALENGNNYDITATSDFSGGGLSVDASHLSGNFGATLDVSQIAASPSALIDFTGGQGDDTIIFGANLGNAGTVDGGGGTNALALAGNGTDVTTTFDGSAFSNFSALGFEDGNNYNLTVTNGFGGGGLTIDASALSASYGATVDASQVGGPVNFTGGTGEDTITFAGQFGNLGTVDGGAGNDTIRSSGILTLSDTNVSHVETVAYSDDGAGNAGLTITGDITTGGGTLSIDASSVDASVSNAIDLTAATTTAFHITGGAGNDTITIGGNLGGSTIDGGAGDNTVTLDGDYSAGITLSMLTNIGEVDLTAGHSYTITLAASNASSGDFYLAGDALGAGDSLTVDSTAVTSGEVDIDGGAGNDTITTGVTSGNTYLDLSQGGEDTVHGGSANDSIYMGDALDAGDRIDGGGGFNTVYLEGDSYAGGLDLGAGELTNINYVQVYGNHTYVLTGDPAALNGSHFLTVDGGAMTGGSLQFDGSAVTDGTFSLYGGAGDDILKGGSGNDTLDLSVGGEDQLAGNGGNDIINAGGGLDAADQVDGGAGADTLNFDGDYSAGLVLGATTVTNVETFHFAAGHSYNITTNDATVSGTAVADTLLPGTLTVDGSKLGASDVLVFDGSAEKESAFVITGGAGNDVLTGGAGADTFDLSKGGNDTANGGLGNDSFTLGGALTAADSINGGGGSDTLTLNGDYSSALTFGASTIANIATLTVTAGHNYDLVMNDGNLAAGATLTVNASGLGSANSLIFDGSAETDGIFSITGGAGNDVITGGAQADSITLGSGGNDTVHAGDGNDQIFMMTQWTSADVIDGGAGSDFVGWGGKDYTGASALVLSATSLNSVEEIQCNASHAYSLTMNDANVAAGATVLIDSTRSTKFTFDGSAETDGHFQIAGGSGADVLTGGQLSDTFMFSAVSNSTSTGYDTITNVNFSSDLVWLDCGSAFITDFKPTGVDAAITTGALSTATFNTDLAAAVNSSTLAAHHAVLFTANSGTLSGHTFLVVDHNGAAGYQSVSDYVIDVTGYTGTLTTSSFT